MSGKTDLGLPAVINASAAPAHALLGASSAHRWMECPPSARLNESAPQSESPFAQEGTVAHELAALTLEMQQKRREFMGLASAMKRGSAAAEFAGDEINRMKLKILDLRERAHRGMLGPLAAEWKASDFEAIEEYVTFVLDNSAARGDKLFIEQKVDYSRFAPEGFGTADAVILSPSTRTIRVADLKFGTGVPVDAKRNPQAMLYALGAALTLVDQADRGKYDTVVWHIHQPRLGYVGTDEMPIRDLFRWAKEVVAPAALLAYKGEGDFAPSEKACRFCAVAPTCRARVEMSLETAREEFTVTRDPATMTPAEIGDILPLLDDWIKWANSLKAEALRMARDEGVTIPGHKLVRGRSVRKWKSGLDIAVELSKIGVAVDDIYAAPEVRSVAQMEKAMGKKEFDKTVGPYTEKPLGTPALVPETDPRPGMDPAKEAAEAFAAAEAAALDAALDGRGEDEASDEDLI